VTVLAGMIDVPVLLTLGAAIDFSVQSLGSTCSNVPHDPLMAGQQLLVVLIQIGRAVQAKDIRQFRHDRPG
jgi:hypothetical protein